MGLFATLQATSSASSSTSSSSLAVPTLVQLFVERPLRLTDISTEDASLSGGKSKWDLLKQGPGVKPAWKLASLCQIPTWACLSYQTTQVIETSTSQAKVDLGIWNCRVATTSSGNAKDGNTGTGVTDALLKIPPGECQKFCFTLDLSEIGNATDSDKSNKAASQVEPRLTQMQQALVRFLIARGNVNNSGKSNNQETEETTTPSSAAAEEPEAETKTADDEDEERETKDNETTSLFKLRTVQFGLAKEDEQSKASATTEDEQADQAFKIALMLCVILPPQTVKAKGEEAKDEEEDNANEDSYQAKQTLQLFYYHLRKYAFELNCTLVFVDPSLTGTSSDSNAATSNACSVSQLALLWRSYCLGQPIWSTYPQILELPQPLDDEEKNDDTAAKTEPNEETEGEANGSDNATSFVYGPNSYQEDLLDSVLLRNAQYPGHWDASKESLWTILPDMSAQTKTSTQDENNKSNGNNTGDMSWLMELKDSMDAVAGTDTAAAPVEEKAGLTADDLLATIGGAGSPAPSKKAQKAPKTPATQASKTKKDAASTPGDAAAFFESLLK